MEEPQLVSLDSHQHSLLSFVLNLESVKGLQMMVGSAKVMRIKTVILADQNRPKKLVF